MQSNSEVPKPDEQMLKLSQALEHMRDSWVELSLILRDHLAEHESPQNQRMLVELERYFISLRDSYR